MHPKTYVKQGTNKIPVFVLPDATGTSKEQLEKVCSGLDRPVVYFRDLRLDNKDVPIQISLDRLVKSYSYSIMSALEELKLDSSCPILIIGYSGGGVLLNTMMKQIQEDAKDDKDEDIDHEEKRRFSEAVKKMQSKYILPVYIDSVAPHLMNEMLGKDFANHLVEVLLKIKGKYNQIVLNGAIINGKPSSKWPFNESKINQLNWLKERLQIRISDTQAELVQIIIDSFLRDFNVMLANHKSYCTCSTDLSASKISNGAVIASSVTQTKFSNLENEYLGYPCESSISKLTLLGTHYTILDGENAEKLSRFLNNKIFINDYTLIKEAILNQMIQLTQKYNTLSPERKSPEQRAPTAFFKIQAEDKRQKLRQNLERVLEWHTNGDQTDKYQPKQPPTLAMEVL